MYITGIVLRKKVRHSMASLSMAYKTLYGNLRTQIRKIKKQNAKNILSSKHINKDSYIMIIKGSAS